MAAAIPGPRGRDLARVALGFTKNPYQTIWDMYQRYGKVFAYGYGPLRYVYLIGPEANHYLLAGNPDNFRWREAFAGLIPVDGETALVVSDGEEHRRRRKLVQPAFHKKHLDAYLGFMVDYAGAAIAAWNPGEVIDVYQVMRSTVRQIVIRSLFGDQLSVHADFLGRNLQPLLEFVNLLPTEQWKINLPGTRWNRVLEARGAVDGLIYDTIRRRRARPSESEDVMTLLLQTRDEEGDHLSDQEIRDQVVSLIAAGYDTTSAAVGWAIYAMLKQPAIWERAAAEAREALGDRPLGMADLGRLPYLDWVISETLRLYSPASIGARKAVNAFELHGHTIPAGSMVIYSQYVTHRMPEIWGDPLEFRPERWDPAAAGHRPPTPYEYLPFGGGARRCIGSAFALMEIKVILIQLLRQAKLSLMPQTVTPTGLASMSPREGIKVRVG